jgi:hypothetical protein
MEIKEKAKKVGRMTVLAGGIGLMAYGSWQLTSNYAGSFIPITSGTKVTFKQECLEKTKEKDKEVCTKRGPVVIFRLKDAK